MHRGSLLRYGVVSSLLVPVVLPAQAPRPTVLAKPDAVFAEPLSSVRGLRELPNGMVLVSDGIEDVLLRIDLARGTADTVGRAGPGPGEYKSPDLLYPLPAGGTLLVDLGNARLSSLTTAGAVQRSWSIARGEPGRGGIMIVPQGVDQHGAVYTQAGAQLGGGSSDSASVIRWTPATDAIDTVARVKLPAVKETSSGSANNRSISRRSIPYSPQDGWAVAPDGRIAVVRLPYQVVWIGPGGKETVGPANAFRPVPIREADKVEYLEQSGRDGLRIGVTNRNGEISMSMGRGGPQAPSRNLGDFDWPATKPAFVAGGLRVAPTGELWVERYVAAGAPVTYDLFDGAGRLVRQVVLPAGRRFAGFGNGVVYLTREDDSGLVYLERYRLAGKTP